MQSYIFMKKIFFGICFLLISMAVQAQDANQTANKDDVPSIKLKDINGKEVDLQELTKQGKPLIISFWATWCSPCKKELENMNEVIDEWQKKYGVVLVAISIDDARNSMKVKPFVDGKKWGFPVLLDVNQDVKRALNIPNVPYTILVDKNGKISYRHVGYTEGDEQVLESKLAGLVKK